MRKTNNFNVPRFLLIVLIVVALSYSVYGRSLSEITATHVVGLIAVFILISYIISERLQSGNTKGKDDSQELN